MIRAVPNLWKTGVLGRVALLGFAGLSPVPELTSHLGNEERRVL